MGGNILIRRWPSLFSGSYTKKPVLKTQLKDMYMQQQQ